MTLRPKLIFFLSIVFLIIGLAVSLSLATNLKKRELVLLREENQRIIQSLVKEFFFDLKIWEESQIITGPYGFEKTGVKQAQEKFIDIYQELTGQKLVLFNIYNNQGLIIASNFKEIEGLKLTNPSLEKVLNEGQVISEIVDSKKIHAGSIYEKIVLKSENKIKEFVEINQPIKIEGEIVGAVESYFVPELKLREHLPGMILIIMAGFILIVLTVFLFFTKFILRPLKIIRKATDPISRGIFSGYIKGIEQKDEIGELAQDFNTMIRGLNSLSGEINRLKEIGKMKSEFISITAHQLRTPLSGIKWALELAVEKEQNEEIRNWLGKTQELNGRMIDIISDLLNAARIEEGRFGYLFQEKIDLASFLEKIANSYKIKMEEKNLDFIFDKQSFDNLYLKADPDKLEIAFSNLIENAINYTHGDGFIKINKEKFNNFVVIKIQDAGIGIDEKDLPRLFGKFFRGQNAISTQPNGSGIGLFITKNIVQAHGGETWAESKLNEGTTFYVKLPLVEEMKESDKSLA